MKVKKLLLLKVPLMIFLLGLNMFLGCTNSNRTKQKLSNNTTGELCPEIPLFTLDSNNVELIELSQETITKSGIAHKSKGIAYTFDGKKDQKLDYETNKDLCIWIYTPENEILSSGTLPTTGRYTIQVTAIKASTTFDLNMSLQDVQIASKSITPAASLSQSISKSSSIKTAKEVGWIWLGAVNNRSGTYSYGDTLIPTTRQPVTITPSIVPDPGSIVTLKTGANIRSDVPKPPFFKLAPPKDRPLNTGQSLKILRVEGFVDTNSDISLTRIWAEVTFP